VERSSPKGEKPQSSVVPSWIRGMKSNSRAQSVERAVCRVTCELHQGLPTLEACGHNVLVQYLLKQVMHWRFVLLGAFFVESQPPSRTIVIVIIDCAEPIKPIRSNRFSSFGCFFMAQRVLIGALDVPVTRTPADESLLAAGRRYSG
jgi:hypothetical protein